MRTISRIVASHVDASGLADDLCETRVYGTFVGSSERDRADARLTAQFHAVGTPRRCKNRSSGGLQATRGASPLPNDAPVTRSVRGWEMTILG
ncbi:MAG: hypothetical protein EB020_03610 [Proteobacteria bacterium]|nr:hypothetical protein [Pseudomonadota bacterium]